jgi:hypothetical protein
VAGVTQEINPTKTALMEFNPNGKSEKSESTVQKELNGTNGAAKADKIADVRKLVPEKGGEAAAVMTDFYTQLMKINTEFSSELSDLLKHSNAAGAAKIRTLIQEQLETSDRLARQHTSKIQEWYHKHSDITLAFHSKFTENMRVQSEMIWSMQNKGIELFTEWASEWWKPAEKDGKKM